MNNLRNQKCYVKLKGFTLIELLIVVAIISILAAIAIPGYLGMQERSRKGAVIRACSSGESELQGWLNSALKGIAGGTGIQGTLIEVDTNGDGRVTVADSNNSGLGALLAAGTLCSTYVSAKYLLQGEKSPWATAAGSLWVDAASSAGAIACSAAQSAPFMIVLTAQDGGGATIHAKTLYAD